MKTLIRLHIFAADVYSLFAGGIMHILPRHDSNKQWRDCIDAQADLSYDGILKLFFFADKFHLLNVKR